MAEPQQVQEGKEQEAITAPKLTPRISRSRCFNVYKWLLIIALIAGALATLASIPWCISLTRQLLEEHNASNGTSPTMAQLYNSSGQEQLLVTDELIYIIVGVSIGLTLLYLLIGILVLIKESFIGSLLFGITLLLCTVGSVFYMQHLLVLINLIVDAVLGLLIILYALTIKRADRLSPETADDLDEVGEKKRQQKQVEEDKV